jgi:hypothetical protein
MLTQLPEAVGVLYVCHPDPARRSCKAIAVGLRASQLAALGSSAACVQRALGFVAPRLVQGGRVVRVSPGPPPGSSSSSSSSSNNNHNKNSGSGSGSSGGGGGGGGEQHDDGSYYVVDRSAVAWATPAIRAGAVAAEYTVHLAYRWGQNGDTALATAVAISSSGSDGGGSGGGGGGTTATTATSTSTTSTSTSIFDDDITTAAVVDEWRSRTSTAAEVDVGLHQLTLNGDRDEDFICVFGGAAVSGSGGGGGGEVSEQLDGA